MIRSRSISRGFTLLEMLVGATVFAFMALMLVTISNHVANVWSRNQSLIQTREKARTVLDFLAREMRQAVLPLNPTEPLGPQFVLNPSGLSPDLLHRDAVFWVMPLSASAGQAGDLAGIGYFIRKVDGDYRLCRFYVEPDDADFAIYDTADWITGKATRVAAASHAEKYRGLFLEGTLGLWVTAYDEDGQAFTSWDSRVTGRLPARVKLSVAVLDRSAAVRLDSMIEEKDLKEALTGADHAHAFVRSLPEPLRPSVYAAEVNIGFQHR